MVVFNLVYTYLFPSGISRLSSVFVATYGYGRVLHIGIQSFDWINTRINWTLKCPAFRNRVS